MSSGFKNTFNHFKNYLSADIATKALSFFSIPILTRILGITPSDYGYIALFTTYISIFICIGTLNSYTAVGRYYYEQKDDFKEFFGTTVNLNVLLIVVVGLGALLFADSGSKLLDITKLMYILMIPAVAFSIGGSLFSQVFQARQESKKVARYSIATAYIGFALTVVFTLLNSQQKYLGSIYSQVTVSGLFMFYIIRQLRPYYTFAFKKAHLRYMLTYSIPLIPYFLSSIILGQFDRMMVAQYTNVSDAGLYSFAYNIGMLLAIFIGSLNSAWAPKYFDIMNRKAYDEHDHNVRYLHLLILFCALALIYFGKNLGQLLGSKNFHSSLRLIPIVALSYVFFAYFYFFTWNIGYVKKTIYSSVILLVSGALNIVLNVLFIPHYGYEAAAYTTLVSYIFMAVFAWGVNRYILKIHAISIQKLYKHFLIFLCFASIYYAVIELDRLWIEIIAKLALLAIFGYICFYDLINKFIRQWRGKHMPKQ